MANVACKRGAQLTQVQVAAQVVGKLRLRSSRGAAGGRAEKALWAHQWHSLRRCTRTPALRRLHHRLHSR